MDAPSRLVILLATLQLTGFQVVSAAHATTTGFLSEPTDQIAVPGMLAGAEVTPEGDLYTGWAEYQLRYGRHLKRWDQPTRTLPDPSVPLLSSLRSDGLVDYHQTVFATPVNGMPVAYDTITVVNHSHRSATADVAMLISYTRGRLVRGARGALTAAHRYERPALGSPGLYEQPGEVFSPTFRYRARGRDLQRSGRLLARGPAYPGRPLHTPRLSTPTATHDGRVFSVRLAAGARASFTWQIPLSAPAAAPAVDHALDSLPRTAALARLRAMWRAQERGLMRIVLPETRVTSAYRAAIVEMLESRYRSPLGWVQASNKLQYQALWIRDAALETQALDLAGLHAQAAQNLGFLRDSQRSDGLFISRIGQYDGLGQVLWALGQHAALTDDRMFAASQLEHISAAINWLTRESAADPLGLLPPSDPGDDELAYGHITGDDLWTAIGLRSAIQTAELAGQEQLASSWRGVDERFEGTLQRSLDAAYARDGHIPPVLDHDGGQDWGNYTAAYPMEVLPARSPEVQATVRWARAHMRQGIATYANGRSLHDYLGFSVFQTELAGGQPLEALAGLYAELAHTTSTYQGWEWDISPNGSRSSAVNLSPHGTFAADYVALLRNLLLRERPDGSIDLLAGASPAWLAPGERIALSNAPSSRGTISFVERSTVRGETLRWKSRLAPGTVLRWTLPGWARDIRLRGRRIAAHVIALHRAAGMLTVSFHGHRPLLSYAATVSSLNRLYRAMGQPEPLIRSTH